MTFTASSKFLLSTCMGLAIFGSVITYASPTLAAGISVTKYPDKPKADNLIKIVRGGSVSDAHDPKNPAIRFEKVRLKIVGLDYYAVRARPGAMSMDNAARKKARNSENGFSTSWEKNVNLTAYSGAMMDGRLPSYTGIYYLVVDTDGDKIAETVYGVMITPKDKEGGFIRGFAKSDDGSAITPAEAVKAGLR